MRAAAAALALALCACASPRRPQAAPGPEPLGLPGRAVASAPPGAPAAAGAAGPELPDVLTLPATYRLMLVDGRLALVRETDERVLQGGGTALRVVAGDPGREEPSYAPAPLPQELAAQLAESRESAARMDGALQAVMQRSRELSDRALELEEQGRRLAELLAASEARVRQLEAVSGRTPAKPEASGP
jgi:hypothetical protein